ncbi:MAG: T9SS type A sorting domain-containing protein, partial [Bacteroidota bacterium]
TFVNDGDEDLRWGNTTDDEMMLIFVHFTDGPVPPVGVEEADLANTHAFQTVPNPYQGQTTISYQLADQQEVTLEIYSLLGERVHTICAKELQAAGQYQYHFGAQQLGLPTGMYLAQLNIGGKQATQKIVELH